MTTEIKLAVVSCGRRAAQMQKIALFAFPSRSPDAADALAAAICYLHQRAFHARIKESAPGDLRAARR